jgi:hypothetical protein
MDDDVKTEGTLGYLRVKLTAGAATHKLWQVVQQGEVVGYLDAKGAAFQVPDVYEMTVLDPEIKAQTT